MDVLTTITEPWRSPLDYGKLVLAIVIFAIIAFALYDSMRVIASYAKGAV